MQAHSEILHSQSVFREMRNRSHYPKEWQDTIRPAILRRDAYRCQHCRALHRSWGYYSSIGEWIECDEFMRRWAMMNSIKVFQIFLQVAHLDQDTKNNQETNLRSLCQRCHLNFDRKFNQIKRLGKRPP